jgi:predicted transcriptional regulator
MKRSIGQFFGILILVFTPSFTSPSISQQAVIADHAPQPAFAVSPNQFFGKSEKPDHPQLVDKDFVTSVLEETARIMGWQKPYYRSWDTMAVSVDPQTGIEAYDDPNRLSLSFNMEPMDEYSPISPDDPHITSFHGYTAFYGSSLQEWEVSLIWNMEGYHFWVYGSNASHSGQAPNIYPYGEALYQAYWNVVEGKSGQNNAPPPEPGNLPADLCAGVTCRNNYCKEDESKYLYDCACDPTDGKCICRADTCDYGCDEMMGGCIDMQPIDPEVICAQAICPEDYCEDDGQTRVYDCKCDPADGECGCYVEVCELGCNFATGRCVEGMVVPDSPDDMEDSSTGGSGYPPSPEPDGPGLLGVLGGVAAGGGILAGGGYLGVKTIQTLLARRAAKAAAQAAANAAEPSLSELLARAENSANRASKAIDQAIEGTADDVRNYKDFLKRTTKQNEAWAKTMADRAKMIERAEKGVKAIKKGADVTAEILGNVPGTGTVFKYSYNLSTTAAESIASGDSVGTVALKTTSKGLETAVGDKLFGKITVLDNLPKDLSKSTIKTAFKKVGAENIVTEAVKNEGTNNMMNVMKEIKTRSPFGKIEKGIEKAAKKVDRKFIGKTIKKIFY